MLKGITYILHLRNIKCVKHLIGCVHYLFIILSIKRRNSSYQNIENYTYRPNITSLIINTFQNLRRHIIRLNITKITVPTNDFIELDGFFSLLNLTESPKSISFSGKSSWLFKRRKFYGFRSR